MTHFVLYIFKIIYNFKIKLSINKKFGNTFAVLTADNKNKAGINYED